MQVDFVFPKTGRAAGLSGKVVEEWERVPAPEQVLRAIEKVSRRGR